MTQREATTKAIRLYGFEARASRWDGQCAIGNVKDPDGGFSPWVVGESYEDCFAQLEKS